MIRGDLLRAKSVQATVAHKQELASLGVIREREVQARDRLHVSEARFWREISIASAQKVEAGQVNRAGQAPAALARALEAHGVLQQAKVEHTGITTEFNNQLARVLRAKTAVTAFKKIQVKEQRQLESRRIERQGEEVAEIGISAKQHTSHRNSWLGRGDRGEDKVLARGAEELRECRDTIGSSPNVGPLSVPVATHTPPVDRDTVKGSEYASHVGAQLSVHAATVSSSEQGGALRVEIESRGVPVTCSVASKSMGRVGVVVEVPVGTLSRRIDNERAGLVARLAQHGIKVANIEVRHGSDPGTSLSSYARRGRRASEEFDENTIA